MIIKNVIEKINGFALVLNDENKHYRFCSSYDWARCLKEDYIYIPLLENDENAFEQLKLHLQNPSCKGFLLNRSTLDEVENQNSYHKLMREFSSKIEVLVLVRNVFNSALAIAQENVEEFSPQIVSIAGSEEKTVLVNLISFMLSKYGLTLASPACGGPWQKLFEPLLMLNKNTKFCVLNIEAQKNNVSQSAGEILKNNTIIFSKTSVNCSARYKGAQNYIYEITSILDNPENIKNVFTYEENDLINSNLGQVKHLVIIEEGKIQSRVKVSGFRKKTVNEIKYENLNLETQNYSYYIKRCAVMAAKCAMSLGVDTKTVKECLREFKDISKTCIETKLPDNNYVFLSTLEHTHFSVRKSIEYFCEKYNNSKKILVLSKILGLEEYNRQLHQDILKLAASKNFDTIVLIDMADYGAFYKSLDKFAHIKKFSSKNNRLDERELMDLGLFLKGKMDNNSALIVCTHPLLNLDFLF